MKLAVPLKWFYRFFELITVVFLIVSSVLVVLFLTACVPSDKKPNRVNVLFILADDLGYNDLQALGSKYYETPNIDRIASEGMVFTNGYSSCQVCSPSRASIMTGKSPARHGITDWIGAQVGEDWRKNGRFDKLLPPDYNRQLPHEYTTLPEALQGAGYKTFFAGKWHLGRKGSWPTDHGFHINVGGWDAGFPKGGYFSPFNNPNLNNLEKSENLSMRLAQETVGFMEENKESPFFAFLSFYAVHSPIETTLKKWAYYRDKAEQQGIKPAGFKMGESLPVRQVQDNPIYAGLVATMDDAVAVVLNALEDLGLDENTIVIFTSDNGGVSSGDDFSTSNLPLRGGKGSQFEGGIREPFFINVPWMNGGKISKVPVIGTDFYPTILDLIGMPLSPEEHPDGVSLVPLLEGKKIKERPLIWHYPHYGNQGGKPSSIIRDGDWKLIHYYEDGSNELYNLTNDNSETTNLAGDNPQLVKRLSGVLFGYLNYVGARFPREDTTYDEELKKRYTERKRVELLPQLEEQRMIFLSKGFNPGNDWWGSGTIND